MLTPKYGNVNVDDNTEHLIIAAPSAGYYLHISSLIVASTTAVAQNVTIKDGASGSTICVLTFPAAAGTQIMTFAGPGLRLGDANALAAISSSASANLQASAVGWTDRV